MKKRKRWRAVKWLFLLIGFSILLYFWMLFLERHQIDHFKRSDQAEFYVVSYGLEPFCTKPLRGGRSFSKFNVLGPLWENLDHFLREPQRDGIHKLSPEDLKNEFRSIVEE